MTWSIAGAVLAVAAYAAADAVLGAGVRSVLGRYDLDSPLAKQLILPEAVSEASGLAVSEDGKLFVHDDEKAIIYEVDPRTGKIVGETRVGEPVVQADFEGIAIRRGLFYLVTSNGLLYEVRKGNAGAPASYHVYPTGLSQRNDVEGLEYDAETDSFLLACKAKPGKGYGGKKAIYAFDMKTRRLVPEPRFLIELEAIKRDTRDGRFDPSGIARHPTAGTYFVISATGRSIVELSPRGTLLAQLRLPKGSNKQPEGIAFLPDGTMVICNDGQEEPGTLSTYPLSP